MNLDELDLQRLDQLELRNTDGGFIGVAVGIAALAVSAYGVAMGAAYYKGYEDAKDGCPPPPCT